MARPGIGGLVAAQLVLQVEVGGDRIADRAGHQRRAGVVEVNQAVAAGGIRAPARQSCCGSRGHRSIHAPSSSMPRCQ